MSQKNLRIKWNVFRNDKLTSFLFFEDYMADTPDQNTLLPEDVTRNIRDGSHFDIIMQPGGMTHDTSDTPQSQGWGVVGVETASSLWRLATFIHRHTTVQTQHICKLAEKKKRLVSLWALRGFEKNFFNQYRDWSTLLTPTPLTLNSQSLLRTKRRKSDVASVATHRPWILHPSSVSFQAYHSDCEVTLCRVSPIILSGGQKPGMINLRTSCFFDIFVRVPSSRPECQWSHCSEECIFHAHHMTRQIVMLNDRCPKRSVNRAVHCQSAHDSARNRFQLTLTPAAQARTIDVGIKTRRHDITSEIPNIRCQIVPLIHSVRRVHAHVPRSWMLLLRLIIVTVELLQMHSTYNDGYCSSAAPPASNFNSSMISPGNMTSPTEFSVQKRPLRTSLCERPRLRGSNTDRDPHLRMSALSITLQLQACVSLQIICLARKLTTFACLHHRDTKKCALVCHCRCCASGNLRPWSALLVLYALHLLAHIFTNCRFQDDPGLQQMCSAKTWHLVIRAALNSFTSSLFGVFSA